MAATARRKASRRSAPRVPGEEHALLLQAVYAEPDDDAPRLVYADFLQQHGDPRGELIALQLQASLARPQRERVAALLRDKALVAGCVGPLAAIVRDPVIERGFLHACRLEMRTPAHRKLLAHPAWSTVRELETSELSAIESSAMRSVRTLRGVGIEKVAELARRPALRRPAALASIEYFPRDEPLWREICEGLAGVCALELVVCARVAANSGSGPDAYRWLLDSTLGKQLEQLDLDHGESGDADAHEWLAAMRERPNLRRVTLRHLGGRGHRWRSLPIGIAREGNGFALDVEIGRVSVAGKLGTEVHELDRLLDGFPDPIAPTVTVRVDAAAAYFERVRAHLERPLAKRFAAVAFEHVGAPAVAR